MCNAGTTKYNISQQSHAHRHITLSGRNQKTPSVGEVDEIFVQEKFAFGPFWDNHY